jgi:hypothetical protein
MNTTIWKSQNTITHDTGFVFTLHNISGYLVVNYQYINKYRCFVHQNTMQANEIKLSNSRRHKTEKCQNMYKVDGYG